MGMIKELSKELVNQIAAGEVIESPHSLIKELIENSIDAKATSIEINLENSGITNLSLTDNGIGISKEDLPLAPIRYATSKIQSFDDLYNISTMGFRGEALASIFSIAKVKLKSKTKSSEHAYEISNTKDKTYEPIKTSHSNGTTIEIQDLFYNVPARKKYLRSENLELKSIIETVKKILIINPQLQLTLKNNGRTLIQKKYHNNQELNIKEILQLSVKTELFEINHSTSHAVISGFLAHPSENHYSTAKYCFIYVNNRPIQSSLIHKAIMNGIGTEIIAGRFPLYVLNITIDPQLIDVNIHPTKKEIKFEQEHILFDAISEAIQNIFKEQLLFKKAQTEKKQNPKTIDIKPASKLPSQTQKESNYFTKDIQTELQTQTEEQEEIKQVIKTPRIQEKEIENITPTYGPLYEYLKEYRIIGQAHKTFIIIETLKGVLMIDQHVAEEKFYYELFKKEYESKQKSSQELLQPQIINISQEQVSLFNEYESYFTNVGFEISQISDNQLMVRKIPLDLKGKMLSISLIKDMLDSVEEFSKSSKSFDEFLIEHLSILSCKSSIRAGDELTYSQIKSIIEQLKVLQEPFNCPHGRPIIVEFTKKELDSMFNRH